MKIQKQRLDFILPLFSGEIFIMMWYNIAMKWGVNMTDSMDAYRIWRLSFCYYKQCEPEQT